MPEPRRVGTPLHSAPAQIFEEYQDISRGEKQPELFWHNREWQNVWSSWLGYRRALSEFMKSRGFKLLIEEMDSDS